MRERETLDHAARPESDQRTRVAIRCSAARELTPEVHGVASSLPKAYRRAALQLGRVLPEPTMSTRSLIWGSLVFVVMVSGVAAQAATAGAAEQAVTAAEHQWLKS